MKGINTFILNDYVIIQALQEYFDRRFVGNAPFIVKTIDGEFNHKIIVEERKPK